MKVHFSILSFAILVLSLKCKNNKRVYNELSFFTAKLDQIFEN